MNLQQNKGTALTEFAISLLFFVPVLIGMIDICIMLTNYQKMEQAVREGVRTASRLPILTDDVVFTNSADHGTFPTVPPYPDDYYGHDTLDNINECSVLSPPPPEPRLDCGHVLIHARVRAILRHENLIGVQVIPIVGTNTPYTKIESLFCQQSTVATANCPVDPTQDSISLTVSGTYNGFFGSWPLTASYQGPWLFQNVTATN